jgi:WD40 repeat protein
MLDNLSLLDVRPLLSCRLFTLVPSLSPLNFDCRVLPCNVILSGSNDGSVRVWELATAECVSTLRGHLEPVVAVVAGR